MAAPIDSASGGNQNPHLIDDLESAFLNCLSLLTSQEYFNVQDSEETKNSIENGMQKFLELSRQTEAFFLRKKMLVSFQKPEQLLSDDFQDLKAELARKEQLLERHTERLKRCQLMLQSNTQTGQPHSQPHPPSQPPQIQPQVPHPVPTPHMAGGGAMGQFAPPHGNIQQMPPQGPGIGHYQTFQGGIHTPPVQGGPQQMQQPHPMGMGARAQAPPSYPQGPLAYLEQTTSNIGMPDRR